MGRPRGSGVLVGGVRQGNLPSQVRRYGRKQLATYFQKPVEPDTVTPAQAGLKSEYTKKELAKYNDVYELGSYLDKYRKKVTLDNYNKQKHLNKVMNSYALAELAEESANQGMMQDLNRAKQEVAAKYDRMRDILHSAFRYNDSTDPGMVEYANTKLVPYATYNPF